MKDVIINGNRFLNDVIISGNRFLNDVIISGNRSLNDVIISGNRFLNDVIISGNRFLNYDFVSFLFSSRISSNNIKMDGMSKLRKSFFCNNDFCNSNNICGELSLLFGKYLV